MQEYSILGIRLTDYTIKEALRMADRFLDTGALNTVTYLSGELLDLASGNETVREALEAMDLTVSAETAVPEAAGIATKAGTREIEERIYLRELLKKFARNRNSVYLLADTQEALWELKDGLEEYQDNLYLIGEGVYEEYGHQPERLVNGINDLAPDVIISCLPIPEGILLEHEYGHLVNAELWLSLPVPAALWTAGSSAFEGLRRRIRHLHLNRRVKKYGGAKGRIAFHLNCLEQGGAERVVTNLAHQFYEEGYEVYLATEWTGEKEFAIDPGIHRVHVGLTPGEEERGRLMQFLLRIRHLRRFMSTQRPDVLIAFAQRANYRALMAAPGTGVPVIISIRTDPVGHYDALSDKLQIPLLFPRAAGCVFQTEGQREFFPKYIQKKSRIILNPIHEKYIGVPEPVSRTKTVVQSGRLVDFKNQLMLIRAFVKVHEKHPDYDLKIYGPDSFDGTRELLEALIEEKQAASYVTLMGGSDELEKVLIDAAVYAFSSDWEGMPNALLEAMALGLPIVATDCPCGGPRTVLQNGYNGLLVPIMDEERMAEGICYLIENPAEAERMGRNARKIAEIANGRAVFEQWRDYIDTITGS